MNKRAELVTVLSNNKLNHDTHLLIFQSGHKLDEVLPGQFVNIFVPDSPETFLRRPFSFCETDIAKGTFSVLVKVVGSGTKRIAETGPGSWLNILYPLGNGFSLPQKNNSVLLVGGGVGIAPMVQLAKESKKIGADVHILLGARSKHDHVLLDVFEKFGKVYLTTNDGSLGTAGFVTDHPVLRSSLVQRIYCCGPDPMMHAVARIASEQDIYCEVSLENTMACGFGVCLCCVTKTSNGNKCVCTEGPVFNIKDLKWPN